MLSAVAQATSVGTSQGECPQPRFSATSSRRRAEHGRPRRCSLRRCSGRRCRHPVADLPYALTHVWHGPPVARLEPPLSPIDLASHVLPGRFGPAPKVIEGRAHEVHVPHDDVVSELRRTSRRARGCRCRLRSRATVYGRSNTHAGLPAAPTANGDPAVILRPVAWRQSMTAREGPFTRRTARLPPAPAGERPGGAARGCRC